MTALQRLHAAPDSEEALWIAFGVQRNNAGRESLFGHYSRFAAGMAWRFYRRHSLGDLDLADIRQLAFAGLLEAIDRFDPERGVPFKAFAAHRITGGIRDGVAHMTEVREQISWRHRLTRERMKSLQLDRSESKSTTEAMAALAEVAIGLALGFMLEDTGMMASDEQASASAVTAYESSEWRQLVSRLNAELAALSEREGAILKYHYIDGLSFDQIATLFGLSNARISQLHKGALMTLRKRLAASGHFRLER